MIPDKYEVTVEFKNGNHKTFEHVIDVKVGGSVMLIKYQEEFEDHFVDLFYYFSLAEIIGICSTKEIMVTMMGEENG